MCKTTQCPTVTFILRQELHFLNYNDCQKKLHLRQQYHSKPHQNEQCTIKIAQQRPEESNDIQINNQQTEYSQLNNPKNTVHVPISLLECREIRKITKSLV